MGSGLDKSQEYTGMVVCDAVVLGYPLHANRRPVSTMQRIRERCGRRTEGIS